MSRLKLAKKVAQRFAQTLPLKTKISSERPEGDLYPEWHSSWGREPRELPEAGSIRAYLPLSETLDEDHFRRLAKQYGAVISQEKEKNLLRKDDWGRRIQEQGTYFQVWMMDQKGTVFGYHYSPRASSVKGNKWTPVEFAKKIL